MCITCVSVFVGVAVEGRHDDALSRDRSKISTPGSAREFEAARRLRLTDRESARASRKNQEQTRSYGALT